MNKYLVFIFTFFVFILVSCNPTPQQGFKEIVPERSRGIASTPIVGAHSCLHDIITIGGRRGERNALVQKMMSDGSFYNNPKYYQFFSKDLEYTKKMLERWYGNKAKVLIEKVSREMGEEYITLLADPGTANRLDKLFAYTTTLPKKISNYSPWEIREGFSKHLGTTKVFRGMVLTEKQKDAMMASGSGIFSPMFMNDNKSVKKVLSAGLAKTVINKKFRTYVTSPIEEVAERLGQKGNANYSKQGRIFISVSKYREIAETVGFDWSMYRDLPGYKLYVFEAEIPKISVIWKTGLFKQRPTIEMISRGKEFRVRFDDLGVEMFVPYKIDSKHITKVTGHDTPPPPFND